MHLGGQQPRLRYRLLRAGETQAQKVDINPFALEYHMPSAAVTFDAPHNAAGQIPEDKGSVRADRTHRGA